MIQTLYQNIIRIGEWVQPVLLLLLRLLFGYAFFEAGLGKLQNIERTAAFFATLHIPLPTLQAYLVGGIETAGGVLLMFGLASRLAGLLLAITMGVALLTAEFEAVKHSSMDFNQLIKAAPFPFFVTALLVWAFGPGAISIDALLKRFIFKSSGK